MELSFLNNWTELKVNNYNVVLKLLEKLLLEVAGGEATHSCRCNQLFGGLKEGIEGEIHAMRMVWLLHSSS